MWHVQLSAAKRKKLLIKAGIPMMDIEAACESVTLINSERSDAVAIEMFGRGIWLFASAASCSDLEVH